MGGWREKYKGQTKGGELGDGQMSHIRRGVRKTTNKGEKRVGKAVENIFKD